MPLVPFRRGDAALIATEGVLAGAHDRDLPVHALHRPGTPQHIDPFGHVVFVPIGRPSHRQVGDEGIALIKQGP